MKVPTPNLSLASYLEGLLEGRRAFYPSPFLVSIVGGGGKTTTLTQLFQAGLRPRSILTTTTAMGVPGTGGDLAPPLTEAQKKNPALTRVSLAPPAQSGLWFGSLIPGTQNKYKGVDPQVMDSWIRQERLAGKADTILYCEADGSKRKPLKAHADHEPVIPKTTDLTLIIFGLSGVGKTFDETRVHRHDIFSRETGRQEGQAIRMEDLFALLDSGHLLKGIPPLSRVAVIFNQTDCLDPSLQSVRSLGLLADRVLEQTRIDAVFFYGVRTGSRRVFYSKVREKTLAPPLSAVILAAGMSSRMEGDNKLLLTLAGEKVIQRNLRQVLASDASDIVLVTGHEAKAIEEAVRPLQYGHDKSVRLVHNPHYQEGQGSSVASGVQALDPQSQAAIFIPGDQPFISPPIIRQLLEESSPEGIVVPTVGGRNLSPVVFGRDFYPQLAALTGDAGGRQILGQHARAILHVPFEDDWLGALDLDRPQDYEKALEKLT